jgi:uncharacterized protein (UPF0261 family)
MTAEREARTIVLVATLDTRGDEVALLRDLIERRGHRVVVVDVGVMGTPQLAADFSREDVAEKGGKSLQELVEAARAGAERSRATGVMIAGAKGIAAELHAAGRLDGIMSLGGSTAAAIGASVMTGLPVGLPKLLVTTFLSLAPIGKEDITVMQSPVDLVGLNRVIVRTLSNAAGAISGMVEQQTPETVGRKLVGITALGVTTPLVQKVSSRLGELGYESVVHHATTEKLEAMCRAGEVDVIFDLTPFETVPKLLYSTALLEMLSPSGEVDRERLRCATERPVPQIIAPGGLDLHIFPGATGIDSVPEGYRDRAWTMHGPNVVLVRTTGEELERVAGKIADRANAAPGPVSIAIPLRGFSDASREGAPLHDPRADRGFIEALKARLDEGIPIVEVDCAINDDDFADAVMSAFRDIDTRNRRGTP